MNEPVYIYILLTDTGTLFTRMIKLYTGAPWNHASLSFDAELRELYSFGRKDPDNPLSGGFVREKLDHTLFDKATCAVYRCPVSRRAYELIHGKIKRIEAQEQLYSYNLLGLLGVIVNRAIEREHAYFCTQFVAAVLDEGGVPLSPKAPGLVTPTDIAHSPALEPVYQGTVRAYASKRRLGSLTCTA